MFSRFCLRASLLMVLFSSAMAATTPQTDPPQGQFAAEQIRHIATHFPGRMAGSPAESLLADYLKQCFSAMGYASNTRSFDAGFLYVNKDTSEGWRKITVTSVIAAKKGVQAKQIIIMAHLDTYRPRSDDEAGNHLGGLTLQGVDDNASGVGVMLELAQRMKDVPTELSLRFIATSGEELNSLGARNYLRRMTPEERDNTLLVINLDNLITGDRLYFHSGRNTPPEMAQISRDRALEIAQSYGIDAAVNPGSEQFPAGTGCCSDQDVFDQAKISVLAVEATNWELGEKDGYQQRAISDAFPQGVSWHYPARDNLQYLEQHLPGQIDRRSHDSVRILLPLIKELAQAPPEVKTYRKKR